MFSKFESDLHPPVSMSCQEMTTVAGKLCVAFSAETLAFVTDL